MIHDTKQIRTRQSRNETNLFGVRIRDYDTKQIHGFAKRIHVFTNLLYESRILNFNSNQMVGSVLFQREISEKDSVGFCETSALFFDEQDDFNIAENNLCPINM